MKTGRCDPSSSNIDFGSNAPPTNATTRTSHSPLPYLPFHLPQFPWHPNHHWWRLLRKLSWPNSPSLSLRSPPSQTRHCPHARLDSAFDSCRLHAFRTPSRARQLSNPAPLAIEDGILCQTRPLGTPYSSFPHPSPSWFISSFRQLLPSTVGEANE